MSNTKRKRQQPSLTYDELQEMKKNEEICPFGRETLVGGVRCRNCYFNHLEDGACYGDKESVKRHRKRLDLEY